MKAILRFALLALSSAQLASAAPDYAIVISSTTKADEGWAKVVEVLQAKHTGATVLTFSNDVHEVRDLLQTQFPKFTCFVATPDETTRKFVANIHQLTRSLDADPYTDTFWGILTGYDAANALRIAQHKDPLTVKRTLSGTPFAIERVKEGIWYSELNAGEVVKKEAGSKIAKTNGPQDSTSALVAGLNDYNADLFITSGHATERDWQIGYRYKNGQFRCADGQIYGLDLEKNKLPVSSAHPRVYLPIGNCLMGHVNGKDSMAAAFMNSAGVMQMAGYTVETWFGYAGWGMLDYFVEQPGRYTLAEAFVANQNALIHRLNHDKTIKPQDVRGLTFDSEVVAFYGDPAWPARMAEGPLNWDQQLGRNGDKFTFTVAPQFGEKTFEAVNTNGSQRGGRPIIHFLSKPVRDVKILEGADLNPVIADNFILIPLPKSHDPERLTYKVVFQAVEM